MLPLILIAIATRRCPCFSRPGLSEIQILRRLARHLLVPSLLNRTSAPPSDRVYTEEVCLVCHSLGCHQTRTVTEEVCLVCHCLVCHQTQTGTKEVCLVCHCLVCHQTHKVLKRSVWCVILWTAITHVQLLKRSVWCVILWTAITHSRGLFGVSFSGVPSDTYRY